jgi:hypothetical protein
MQVFLTEVLFVTSDTLAAACNKIFHAEVAEYGITGRLPQRDPGTGLHPGHMQRPHLLVFPPAQPALDGTIGLPGRRQTKAATGKHQDNIRVLQLAPDHQQNSVH